MKFSFKDNFLWGAAASGPQTEGSFNKKAQSIWEYDSVNNKEKFFNQVSNSVASDFYHNYKHYIKLMKDVGIKSYRTSIQWSRIVIDKAGRVDKDGIEFYHNVIDELIKNNIEPMICLFHFDTPMYWMEEGGFENRKIASAFSDYAEICFKEYGDKVRYWSTFNEPIVVAEAGYLIKAHHPEVVDIKRFAQVIYNLQLSSSMAIKRFRKLKMKGDIGIILNLTPSYPPKEAEEIDIDAANLSDLIFNRSFLDPSVKGAFPKKLIEIIETYKIKIETEPEDKVLLKDNTVDYLGINYYHPKRVKAKSKNSVEGDLIEGKEFFDSFTFEGQKWNKHRGWEIYEPAVYDIAMDIKNNYGNIKWYIAENGMGVENESKFLDQNGIIDDEYRIEFIKEHLKYLHKAIEEGANCFGYHTWTAFDNWSWRNAYKNRYGLISVDIDNNCKTEIKKSGRWFRTLSDKNGF